MNASRITLIVLACLLSVAKGAENLDSFRIIGQRNIFNLHRTPRRPETGAVRPPPRPTVGDTFTLVGTMAYETNQLAFFDGTSSDCRKALKLDDTIAGYKLVSIAFNSVRLEAGGQPFDLRVGARLPRAAGSAAPPSTNIETNVEVPTVPSAPAAPAGDPSEILKKLMQKREQEMK
ncbi:MAG: hypothetical protein FJ395_10715 [Verrucomicrobia bacterium]|nr:hypothetical protein [Verrucomicrobiota bacterium]